ncbi:hypothetical protein GQ55_5G114700 [Panicum hallii var. hallii]|uniref:Uncharacterized protein n=1 Tax=Panicum hallii var. hallii TaxID=1504633 RepID=A0A2T7DF84_9POAL|nr:hypothetical protein GQ55_5G114700 [Panicum hallii var. hallii]
MHAQCCSCGLEHYVTSGIHSKIDVLNIRCRIEYMHLLDRLSCVGNILSQWSACCDLLFGVEKLAYSKNPVLPKIWIMPGHQCSLPRWIWLKLVN